MKRGNWLQLPGTAVICHLAFVSVHLAEATLMPYPIATTVAISLMNSSLALFALSN